ncbi:hypothetical protein [Neisseria wadsworthii]|uniref:hypothetical protein n=1 Tax=Neisseria wadsworthii TaxID=607711 RepID=UPI000D31E19F|nr:hypothetical protein [Neisseria wadsworthii]
MKLGKWLLCSMTLVTLTILPIMNSEAFSPSDLQNDTDCHALSLTPLTDLNNAQKQTALHCDIHEADQAWYGQYGNMHNQDFAYGIVYDPLNLDD